MNKIKKANFSVLITSFSLRFESYLKPLVKSLNKYDKIKEINLIINGDYLQDFNTDYRKKLLQFIEPLDNVYLTMYPKFTGLAKIWNRGILSCSSDWVLVLNDDITIVGDLEYFCFKLNSIIKNFTGEFLTFNHSFSHFLINKNIFKKINYFDERLIGIGEEDVDFIYNYLTYFGTFPPSFFSEELKHFNSKIADNNFKKDFKSKLFNPSKYSKFNAKFMLNKYKRSKKGVMCLWHEKKILNIDNKIQYPYEFFTNKCSINRQN